MTALAKRVGLPVPTAHRQIAALVAGGYLVAIGRGLHVAGPRVRAWLGHVNEKRLMAACAAPILRRLAAEKRAVAQLGTLENEMVTYLFKTGKDAGAIFSRTDMQLEAYCSGIGKVLLANLPEAEQEAYLAGGPFVPLTSRTIVDPERLRLEFQQIRKQDFACDNREIADDLYCLAVPVRSGEGRVTAAISLSRRYVGAEGWKAQDEAILRLHACAAEISKFLLPHSQAS